MFYVMKQVDGVSVRVGRMFKSDAPAIRLAQKQGGYVEQYGKGLHWPLDLGQLKKVMH
jgi:fumarate hydratase class II